MHENRKRFNSFINVAFCVFISPSFFILKPSQSSMLICRVLNSAKSTFEKHSNEILLGLLSLVNLWVTFTLIIIFKILVWKMDVASYNGVIDEMLACR